MAFAIHPPLGGIVQSVGFQSQPEYTCVESVNFWPINVFDGRALTATRPAMADIGFEPEDAGAPVNLLSQLNLPFPVPYAAAAGKLYKRNSNGTWSQVATGTSQTISTGRPVFATPLFTQLLIANSGEPLVYDVAADTITTITGDGTAPVDCRVCMTFQSAVWLGGAPIEPHVFSKSRDGDLTDWDYTDTDEQAAWISTGDDRGLITQPLTAMFPMIKDQAVIGCEEEVWVLTGHPLQNGTFKRVSAMTGVLGQNAICETPKGTFFLSHDGLMGLERNAFDNINIVPMSKNKIPDRLLDIDYDVYNPAVCMAYDSRWNCIFITVRGTVPSPNTQAWAYFLETGGFYEMKLPEYPYTMSAYEPLVSEYASGVLFGNNGNISRFDRSASEEITAHQIIGPVRVSKTPADAEIVGHTVTMFGSGTTDEDATVEMYTAGSAAAAAARAQSRAATNKYATTVGAIRNNNRNWYPVLRGHAATLRIDQDESTGRVVFEDLYGTTTKGGINGDGDKTAPVITPPILLPVPVLYL